MRFLLFSLILFVSACTTPQMQIHFLDAGEGNATLITASGKSILVDATNFKEEPKITARLEELTKGELSALITTHPHQDHIGGIFSILERLTVARRYDNGQPITNQGEPYRWYEESFRKSDGRYQLIHAGDTLHDIPLVTVRVLSPALENLDSDWNKNSLVLRVEFGKFCALLMADALNSTETTLIQKASSLLSCPVIQIGHHGSRFSSSSKFIEAVHAKDAIVSINKDNVRGYPDSETLLKWRKSGATVHKTFEEGEIVVSSETNGTYVIQAAR